MSKEGSSTPTAITGIQAMQGHGVNESRGFWAEAWSQVIRRPSAIFGMAWLGLVAFFAVFAPVIANGHPIRFVVQTDKGPEVSSPLLVSLSASDWLLMVATVFGGLFLLVPIPSFSRAKRLNWIIIAMLAGTVTVLLIGLLRSNFANNAFFGILKTIRGWERNDAGETVMAYRVMAIVACASIGLLALLWMPFSKSILTRVAWLSLAVSCTAIAIGKTWDRPQQLFQYNEAVRVNDASATYTIIPWSPSQRPPDRNASDQAPGQTEDQSLYKNFNNRLSNYFDTEPRDRETHLGVDGILAAKQVLAQSDWSPEAKETAAEVVAQAEAITSSGDQLFSQADLEARLSEALSSATSDSDALLAGYSAALTKSLSGTKRSLIDPFGEAGFDIARDTVESQPLTDESKAKLLAAIDTLEQDNPGARRNDLQKVLMPILGETGKVYPVGTDNLGQDMLSQLLHACRLSISIGLVSTGISLLIGVTVGALMGYFGGWVDLVLYRVVEIFMAIPVLFLLIVAAGVLPKNIYVMMIIIGCFSWTGAARFIRAEFLKLRNMDFVQSARATGLPLRSILFKHMLPNGITPVLVESSFAIAAAILAEATLSYLGLGPDNQASWGKLLASATGQSGQFYWWLAIFPGAAIFLTVLAYNLIGEAFRDAIDPKLKKARV